MEGFCSLQKLNQGALGLLSCWGILGIAGKSAQVFLGCPSSPTQSLMGCDGSRKESPTSRKLSSHPRPLWW